MQSTMFLSNLTVVDHAYVNQYGDIVGGSFNPSFVVEGEVDEKEQVVIDFSTCKKDIKSIIDSKEIGLDHKLWIGNFSNCSVEATANNASYIITTPQWVIEAPENAVRFVDETYYDVDSIGMAMQSFVTRELQKKYPTVNVKVYNNVDAHGLPFLKDKSYFRYSHGLKNSTSWGCQNIAHGHLSYISIVGEDEIGAKALSQKIAAELDGIMFVWTENETQTGLGYTTERGEFKLTVRGNPKIQYCTTETTIENLVEMISVMYAKDLKSIYAEQIYVSEGLSKGAVFYV
jgi:6-pyruvoyl-tetrahydropterin synthase